MAVTIGHFMHLAGNPLSFDANSAVQTQKDGLSTRQAYPDEAAEECGEVCMGDFPWKEQHVADSQKVPAPFLQAWFYLYSCCRHENAAAHFRFEVRALGLF